ncbi:ACT domain-containing protein [Pueribacillus theae]|uniref:ACT domain-containing protein n=1 Tax=Pueribacillus theae TaxID=2171751 RepID=UPI0014030E6B
MNLSLLNKVRKTGVKRKPVQYYLVREDVLTESMRKTLEAKALLESGKAEQINDAVAKVGLSRSAFYKYRDSVIAFHSLVKEKIITLFIFLQDRSGALSQVLQTVAELGCNVLTINQTIPLQGRANVTLSIETGTMVVGISELMHRLEEVDAVERVEVIGSGM